MLQHCGLVDLGSYVQGMGRGAGQWPSPASEAPSLLDRFRTVRGPDLSLSTEHSDWWLGQR